MEIIITGIIAVLVIVIVISYCIIKDKKKEANLNLEKIKEAEKSLHILLEKKSNLLEATIEMIKNSNKRKYTKKEILEDLIKNKNKKLDFYQLYTELTKNTKELNQIIEDDPKLNEINDLNKIRYDLKNIENDLNATIQFYNKAIKELGKERKGLSKFILKTKDYRVPKPFEIVKEEEFEILKEKKKKKEETK